MKAAVFVTSIVLWWVGSAHAQNALVAPAGESYRLSSADATGGNADYIAIGRRTTATIADIKGAGVIERIWITMHSGDRYYLRTTVIRMYWDGEKTPSVEAPLGDFFGLTSGLRSEWTQALMEVAPRDGRSWISRWPMPFAQGARITITNDSDLPADPFYFHIDYSKLRAKDVPFHERFHAQWRRTKAGKSPGFAHTLADVKGDGWLAGVVLTVHNSAGGWYGEGDETITIDGERSLAGTGLEDFFGLAWSPEESYQGSRSGLLREHAGDAWTGFHTWRRVGDLRVRFRQSLQFTWERGHGNDRADDVTSVVYWYQREPHAAFPPLPPAQARIPPFDAQYRAAADRANHVAQVLLERHPPGSEGRVLAHHGVRHLTKVLDDLFAERKYAAIHAHLQRLEKQENIK